MWYMGGITGDIEFPGGIVSQGFCLFNRVGETVNVWLFPSNGRVTIGLNQAKRVIQSLRDVQNNLIPYVGGR